MTKTQFLAAFLACTFFAIPTNAYDKDTHATKRAYIKALQTQILYDQVSIVKNKRELRRAIKAASRDL